MACGYRFDEDFFHRGTSSKMIGRAQKSRHPEFCDGRFVEDEVKPGNGGGVERAGYFDEW
mgnify:CR=1 FL=1